ncbi:MAG: ATP-binding protein, partial [Dehalococcoidia bacterium]
MPELPTGTVTLLFTDIEGSTRLLAQLGDGYDGLLAEHHHLLREAFAAYGGAEVDTQGDAFFVAFSRASDALAGAVAAQRALAAHPWPAGVGVRVRMGLHTGQPRLSGGRYIGLDVNRAARIAAAAHGGQILLSQVMAALVQEELPLDTSLRDLGEYQLKDLDRPEQLFQLVLADLPSVFPPPRTLASSPPVAGADPPNSVYDRSFVGRQAELERLRAAYDASLAGQGALIMVVGEPGIGKTALCEQLAVHVATRGGRTLAGHCYEAGSLSLPYLPFVEVMRDYVLLREPASLRRELGANAGLIARLVPEVWERRGGEGVGGRGSGVGQDDGAGASAEEDRYRLLQAVASFLRSAAGVQPLVLVLEDLHDADRGTLDLLTFLARNLQGARLLLVGTYRDVEVDRAHPLSSTLAELRRVASFSRLLLHGLTAEEVQRMIGGITEREGSWALAEPVHRQTEGNPLFVQEVVRYLAEEGLIAREGGRWRAAGASPLVMSIPEGLRDVIGKRLSRLSPQCNRALAIAAVIGREFDV